MLCPIRVETKGPLTYILWHGVGSKNKIQSLLVSLFYLALTKKKQITTFGVIHTSANSTVFGK